MKATIMQRSNVAICAILCLSGCAEMFLEQNVQAIEGSNRQLNDFSDMMHLACPTQNHGQHSCSLNGAVQLAFNQADAYARAARQSQVTQDLAFGALLAAAGWTTLGAIDGISDSALAESAVTAVAVQQAGQRSVPQSAVQALYQGASRMNCIALSGSLYEEVNLDDLTTGGSEGTIPVRFASFIMVLSMREIEYRTLYGTSRGLEDFSSLINAFSSATTAAVDLPSFEETAETQEGQGEGVFTNNETSGREGTTPQVVIRQNPALERFFGVISGCLDDNSISPDRSARNPN